MSELDKAFKSLPVRQGHFLLESGYHSSIWFNLDAIFVYPQTIKPLVRALSNLLKPFSVTAICGPLLGGAFLAQALASQMQLRFYYTQPMPEQPKSGLFTTEYHLPTELRNRVSQERIAVVDDAISAGSSVRATVETLSNLGASIAVIGAILLFGNKTREHFSSRGIPLISLVERDFTFWAPEECPLCRAAVPLTDPMASEC
jgi:orotate phosphoribosyltransferase